MLTKEEFNSILQKARNLCSRSEKCVFDIRKYVSKNDISEIEIEKTIEILITEKYIDEARYTGFFVNDKLKFNKWGKIKIRHTLRQKKINENHKTKAITNIDNDVYLDTLKSIIRQKNKTIKSKDSIKVKTSLIRFAAGRGFEYDLILDILKEV